MSKTVLAVILLLAIPAFGEDKVFTPEDASTQVGPEIKITRPLDDTDLEMKELAERYFGQGACNRGPGKRCPWAREPLRAGGDRLAEYLIRQYEASIEEGYQNTLTVLSAIGGTESKSGRDYIRSLIRSPRDRKEYENALRALERCAHGDAIDEAFDVLSNVPRDDETARALAVVAIKQNLNDLRGEEPGILTERSDVMAELSRLAADEQYPFVAFHAQKALAELSP